MIKLPIIHCHQLCTQYKMKIPVNSRSLSAKVLLPWSTCAMILKFLIFSTGNLDMSTFSYKREILDLWLNFAQYETSILIQRTFVFEQLQHSYCITPLTIKSCMAKFIL